MFLFPKQVQRAVRELVGNYASARRSIREAAEAAETVGERVVKGDDLQVGLFCSSAVLYGYGFERFVMRKSGFKDLF